MAEEATRAITQQDVQNAARLAAVEVHVHTIRDAVARLEAGQNAQHAVNTSMSESMKKTEVMLATLTTQFTTWSTEISKLGATRDTVIGWKTGVAIVVFILSLVLAALLKEWVSGKP